MLEIDIDKVNFIVEKAREFENQEPSIDGHSDDLRVNDLAEDLPEPNTDENAEDATYDELKSWIDAMNHDDQCQIVALAWVGRGAFAPEDWSDALALARQEHNNRTAEYLLGMPLLPDYLEEGLSLMNGGR